MVRYQGDDTLPMNNRKKTISLLLVLVVTMMIFVSIQPAKAQFVLNKAFVPSMVTYTNKTFEFQDSDPYTYAYWQYEIGTVINTQNTNEYRMQVDQSGEYAYFGFDEFVDHSVVSAEVQYETSSLTGTYHIQPLGFFYQKTNLESKTRWALVLHWDASGLNLYYNTGNGDTPASVHLTDTAPYEGTDFTVKLSNLGSQTYVYIQDISAYPTYPVIYSGYTTTTGVYNATVLYAGFGEYSTGAGDINANWDHFAIIDSTFTYPENGTGFNKIDAYVDEVFTQTLYDMDGGADSILSIAESVTNITLLVSCWLNSTTYGVSTLAEGKNIIRQNITVTATNRTIVFSQNNLTYISATDYGDDVFLYQYSVQLDFTIISGNIYTVVLTYEIYY